MIISGDRQKRDGEPTVIQLRRWENDRTLSADHRLVCCDCRLEHLMTYNVLRGPDGEFYLVVRPYRISPPKKHR